MTTPMLAALLEWLDKQAQTPQGSPQPPQEAAAGADAPEARRASEGTAGRREQPQAARDGGQSRSHRGAC